jgi:hypothetical protein
VKETMKDKDDNSGESAGDEKNPPSGAGQKDPGDLTNADGHKSHRKKPRFFVTEENDLTWPVLFWSACTPTTEESRSRSFPDQMAGRLETTVGSSRAQGRARAGAGTRATFGNPRSTP